MKVLLPLVCALTLALAPFMFARAADVDALQSAQVQSAQDQAQSAEERAQKTHEQAQVNQQTLEVDQQQLEKQMEQARQQMQQAAQRMAQLTLQMEGPMLSRLSHMFDPNRAVLGVSIADTRNAQNTAGVPVEAVTPGGPADRAGLRAGDVITAINGVRFKTTPQESAADQLMDFMDKVKPGEMLKLSYLRDGRGDTAEVKAGRLADYRFAWDIPAIPPPAPLEAEHLRAIYGPWPFLGRGGPWAGMQLVPLSPGLGQYFGTDHGLLVVRAPRNPALKLEDGDVILKIGDREPATPSDAMRILYAYAPGETLTLHILRKSKPLSFSLVVPKPANPALGPYQPMSLRDQAFIARWADQGLG